MSISAQRAATFLNALPKAWGRPVSVGMPSSRLKAAVFAIPRMNFSTSTSSEMSKTAAAKTLPSWKTCSTSMPYSNGLMPSFPKRIAALGVTLSPAALLEDLLHLHAVLEWLDAKLSQENCGTWSHLVANLQDGELAGQFDLTLDNLRTDVERLEERGLGRVHARGARRQVQVHHGHLAGLGGGRLPELLQDLANVVKAAIRGEDETNVAQDRAAQGVEACIGVLLRAQGQRLSDHRVLAHQDNSPATQLHTDVLHLLRGHMVDANEERTGAVDAKLHQLVEVLLLLSELLGVRHSCERKRGLA